MQRKYMYISLYLCAKKVSPKAPFLSCSGWSNLLFHIQHNYLLVVHSTYTSFISIILTTFQLFCSWVSAISNGCLCLTVLCFWSVTKAILLSLLIFMYRFWIEGHTTNSNTGRAHTLPFKFNDELFSKKNLLIFLNFL